MPIIEVKKILVSLVALINDNNEILIGKKRNKENLWEFPGGKVKQNESIENALIRETKEEIDVDLSQNCIAPLTFNTHYKDKKDLILFLFIARKWNNNPNKIIHSELKWVNVIKLRNYKMHNPNHYFVSCLQDLLI